MIGVEGPPPKGKAAGDPYCFDKDIKFYSGEKTAPSTKFADFYKEGCFLIEAKQGSDRSGKGHGEYGIQDQAKREAELGHYQFSEFCVRILKIIGVSPSGSV